MLTKQMHQKSVKREWNFNDVAVVSIKGSDNTIHFWYMSKDDEISIMNNSNLNEESGAL